MKKAALYRIGFVVALFLALELLCLTGIIDNFTMPPPHRIFLDLFDILWSGKFNHAMFQTFGNALIAAILSIVVCVLVACAIHPFPIVSRMLDPVFSTYYAVPVLSFYPVFIFLFGLGDAPKILVGFMLGVVAVIINTLDGLDRVPRVMRKVAKVEQLNWFESTFRVTVPFALPYILSGSTLAVSYSIVGIIATEFIMSREGVGHEISFAYLSFDNATMYPLILLLIIIAVAVNLGLFNYEKRLQNRRGLNR